MSGTSTIRQILHYGGEATSVLDDSVNLMMVEIIRT